MNRTLATHVANGDQETTKNKSHRTQHTLARDQTVENDQTSQLYYRPILSHLS